MRHRSTAGGCHPAAPFRAVVRPSRRQRNEPRSGRELGDLQDVVERLQADAALVRSRRREVRQMRVEHAPGDAGVKLAAMEQALDGRLADSLDALERIRLSLLRLHTGAVSLASITADLGRAGDIAELLTRLADAEQEVAEALR